MNLRDAVLLGVVEGLTEFLPVSSTGHLILLGHWLGGAASPEQKAFADAFDVVIQGGALLAVVVYYRAFLLARLRGLAARDAASLRLARALALGSAPALVAGFLLHKAIERHLFGPRPVALALVLGGVLMALVERRARSAEAPVAGAAGAARPHGAGLEALDARRALLVGLAQCAALWPGTSRSMSTIVGARLVGLDPAAAAEFSFLLALPTLGAATLFKCVKARHVLFAGEGALLLGVGTLVSFAVALAVIAAFLRGLRRFGLVPFAVYRVLLGVAVLALLRG